MASRELRAYSSLNPLTELLGEFAVVVQFEEEYNAFLAFDVPLAHADTVIHLQKLLHCQR